ncbi:metallophosphoesterase family protein [Haloarculaceae archaeon H-GB2-1]|nr:metallophosphoesterase family protein [Haloarculaceae archaeon H-GB1-1]MEA5388625.1 metallophosphoesterase family protein [Haloarculaceae archaeon H-GB11]MEA5406679.1 metallophosphoesterase family protein [Haloarculaceae archaeon H-GB2-1]
MEVALISDTHVPSRSSHVPQWVRDRVVDADHVIHAGDFDSKGAFADVRDLASELTAVHGNMDPTLGLPTHASVELGGVEFVVTHGTGSPRGYLDRVARIVEEEAETDGPVVGVVGHTHDVLDITHAGVRLLNPGSATGAAPADGTTMMVLDVADGEFDVTLREE